MSTNAGATDATRQPTLDAVILAGGRAERLGGASKPDLVVSGRSLLETAIEAAASAGCARIVVVGPPALEAPGCIVVREDPPFGGPVAALAAGLAALATDAAVTNAAAPDAPHEPAPDVLVLACDMPAASIAVDRLLAGRRTAAGTDGVCLVDASGREQWLAAIYSREGLARAFAALGHDTDGAAMRRLAASLDLTVLADDGSTQDIDTWSDLERARSGAGSGEQETAP
jgi:molybdopterin-guanine dinucleotide biosynthesis protein A